MMSKKMTQLRSGHCHTETLYIVAFPGVHYGPEQPITRHKYWATRLPVGSFACTAHSFACSAKLALLAHSAALTSSLARSLLHLWLFCLCFLLFWTIVVFSPTNATSFRQPSLSHCPHSGEPLAALHGSDGLHSFLPLQFHLGLFLLFLFSPSPSGVSSFFFFL